MRFAQLVRTLWFLLVLGLAGFVVGCGPGARTRRKRAGCEGPPRIAAESSTGGEEGDWHRQSEQQEEHSDQAAGRTDFNRSRAAAGESGLRIGKQRRTPRDGQGPLYTSSWFSFTQSLVVGKVVPSTLVIVRHPRVTNAH